MAQQHPVLIIAHRGASGSAPENTLASVQKAIDFDADVIEIDVHLSKDGEVVVIHDKTVDRTTNGKGLVSSLTLEEIKKLDAGSWHSNGFAGEEIPTLTEVIALIAGRKQLLIEVKKGHHLYPGIERKILNIIDLHQAGEWCIIQSFEDEVLDNFKALETGIPLHKLIVGNIPVLPVHIDSKLEWGAINKYTGIASVNVNERFTSHRTVQHLHDQGFTIFVWTVNKEASMEKMMDLGVDGIITNYPEKLRQLIQQTD